MSSRKPRNRLKVVQTISHPDGSQDVKERTFESISDFKRSMVVMGFPVIVAYDLQKHGKAHFDYDVFSVSMTLEVL